MRDDLIYFVDQNDQPTGETGDKLASHNSETKLHAAFSCYVFNEKGQVLVTKRAHVKKVWHGVWTNSCCGHPAPNESRVDSVKRRLQFELGLDIQKIELCVPNYIYKAPPYDGVVEHEYCPIYVAFTNLEPLINSSEVEEYKWIEWDEYTNQLKNDPNDYSMFSHSVPSDKELDVLEIPKWSWWCKDQLSILENNNIVKKYLKIL